MQKQIITHAFFSFWKAMSIQWIAYLIKMEFYWDITSGSGYNSTDTIHAFSESVRLCTLRQRLRAHRLCRAQGDDSGAAAKTPAEKMPRSRKWGKLVLLLAYESKH